MIKALGAVVAKYQRRAYMGTGTKFRSYGVQARGQAAWTRLLSMDLVLEPTWLFPYWSPLCVT